MAALSDHRSERRLLAAMIADDGVLDCCDRIDLDDFTDPRHVAVLTGIREVQENGLEVNVENVGDQIFARDLQNDKHVYASAGHWFLGTMMLEQPQYPNGPLIYVDIFWLKKLAKRRAALK